MSSRRSIGLATILLAAACGEGQPVPGDASRFDAIARYGEMKRFAGEGLELEQLSATGVRDDGMVDLVQTTYHARVEYHFAKLTKAPADAPPVGAGGGSQWKQRVLVFVTRAGDVGEETDAHGSRRVVSKGMRRVEPPPEAEALRPISGDPKCSFADLWKVALERGAPAGSVAHVDYMERRYEFRVSDVGFVLHFDEACEPIEG